MPMMPFPGPLMDLLARSGEVFRHPIPARAATHPGLVVFDGVLDGHDVRGQ